MSRLEHQTPIMKFRNCMNVFLIKLRTWANKQQSKELEKFTLKYDISMRINPMESLMLFLDLLEPHAEHILSGNEDNLLQGDVIVDDVLLNQLKEWWPALEQQQQHYIKKQFQLLVMLGAKATKHEGLRTIINQFRDPSNPLVY
jgi:hypothetical protein